MKQRMLASSQISGASHGQSLPVRYCVTHIWPDGQACAVSQSGWHFMSLRQVLPWEQPTGGVAFGLQLPPTGTVPPVRQVPKDCVRLTWMAQSQADAGMNMLPCGHCVI